MATKRRHIEIVSTKIIQREDSTIPPPSFTDVLAIMKGKEFRFNEKIFEFSLLQSHNDNCIIGLIVTTQDKDIPPKRDKKTKKYSKVSINPDIEGLAYANIFLYDKLKNILLYEINRNGCFLGQLRDFIYYHWNHSNESRFSIDFPVVIKSKEYERMLSMDRYQKIVVELYKPSELLQCYAEKTESAVDNIIDHNIKVGYHNNADFIKIEQISLTKKYNPLGLQRSIVKGIVDSVKVNVADKGLAKNIKELRVEGYTSDFENGKKLLPINLMFDTYNEFFRINDIQVQSDVQESERKAGIISIYNKLLPIFP